MKYANIGKDRVYAWCDVVWPNITVKTFLAWAPKIITGKDTKGRTWWSTGQVLGFGCVPDLFQAGLIKRGGSVVKSDLKLNVPIQGISVKPMAIRSGGYLGNTVFMDSKCACWKVFNGRLIRFMERRFEPDEWYLTKIKKLDAVVLSCSGVSKGVVMAVDLKSDSFGHIPAVIYEKHIAEFSE